MKFKGLTFAAVALLAATGFAGCAGGSDKGEKGGQSETTTQTPGKETPSEAPEVATPVKISYMLVNTNGLNIRAGAGTDYSVRGTAEKSTLYPIEGQSGDWYKCWFRNKESYISKKYTSVTTFAAADEKIERVIEEGGKLLGTPYVYGATRYMDGKGNRISGFSTDKFDCSSLMQYIFYKGAGKVLDVNTRTQVSQGQEVKAADIKRGDLLFFTNASRKNLSGTERIGHVALYLGNNYILHTASDYAKIEQISSTRWGYFVTARRMIA